MKPKLIVNPSVDSAHRRRSAAVVFAPLGVLIAAFVCLAVLLLLSLIFPPRYSRTVSAEVLITDTGGREWVERVVTNEADLVPSLIIGVMLIAVAVAAIVTRMEIPRRAAKLYPDIYEDGSILYSYDHTSADPPSHLGGSEVRALGAG